MSGAREYRPLFVTGLARSGSTLLANMLSAHHAAMVASDPYLELFRSLRNAIVQRRASAGLLEHFDPQSSFQDYYFCEKRIGIMDTIQEADLDIPVAAGEVERLRECLVTRLQHQSPDLIPHLANLGGSTYRDLMNSALGIVAEARSSETCRWVGAKEVWTIEFFAPLARAYPAARFLVIMRDPRAIIASMLRMADIDDSQVAHTVSYLRHWRKYATFLQRYRRHPLLSDRLYTLRYEDLVDNPDRALREICDFLELPWDPNMRETSNFFDYTSGAVWRGNSNFEASISGISSAGTDRWRNQLPPAATKVTDFICGPEMRLAGYQPDADALDRWPEPAVLDYIIHDSQGNFSWRSDLGDPQKDYGFELFRRCLLAQPKTSLDPRLLRNSFLYEEMFDQLQGVVAGSPSLV